jgi:hypothetical protein
LTGPDGQRIELFTEIGGSDDHFEETVFDDQSKFPITKARAPFQGTFTPEALLKRQPSLSHFNGKSVKGVWQLVIRASRSERFGMLHRWSLIVTPMDQMLEAAAPDQDGPQQATTAEQPLAKTESPSASLASSAAEEKRLVLETRQREEKLDAMQREFARLNTISGEDLDDDQREKLEAKKKTYERYMQYLQAQQSGDGPGKLPSKQDFKESLQPRKLIEIKK